MRNYSDTVTILTNPGHQLDDFAKRMLDETTSYYIIGSNSEIRSFNLRIGKILCDLGKVRAFLLTEYGEAEINGIPVIREKDVVKDESTCIICLSRDRKKYEMIRSIYVDNGYEENDNFFQGELFAAIYDVYVNNTIKLDRVEIFLTSCCTLNCEKCIAYVPYFKRHQHTAIEQLKNDADILFKRVDYIYKIKVLGGEGFLYPHLIEYLDYLHDNYKDKIGTIRIGTNGTIFPSKDILEACKRDGVTIDISDYTAAVPNLCKLEEVKKLCLDSGVAVDIKRTGESWLDMGFPADIPEEKSEEQLQRHFRKCAMFCRQFSKGKLFYCCSNFAAIQTGLFDENENDYFDFNKDFDKKELLEFELGYLKLGHLTFCNVCRGCSDEVNPYHVEVAKQVKNKVIGEN